MDDLILSEVEDGVVVLTLNQPASRNAISDLPMIEALLCALREADAAPTTQVIILTGAGSVFSSGGNVKKMGPGSGLADAQPALTRGNYRRGIQQIPLAFESLETPVIAAVNGAAIGAGCDLAMMCDIRIAAESALFAESFVKLGLVPGDGGAWLLPRIVGQSKAYEMALTGDRIDAAQALQCGLVSMVVPDSDLLDAARALARRIAANPAHAVRMTKRLLKESRTVSLPTLLELSAAMQALAHTTPDHAEAVAAFVEKREPRFRKSDEPRHG
jgi:enoyl-CoA hydratase/carnithine racemase